MNPQGSRTPAAVPSHTPVPTASSQQSTPRDEVRLSSLTLALPLPSHLLLGTCGHYAASGQLLPHVTCPLSSGDTLLTRHTQPDPAASTTSSSPPTLCPTRDSRRRARHCMCCKAGCDTSCVCPERRTGSTPSTHTPGPHRSWALAPTAHVQAIKRTCRHFLPSSRPLQVSRASGPDGDTPVHTRGARSADPPPAPGPPLSSLPSPRLGHVARQRCHF